MPDPSKGGADDLAAIIPTGRHGKADGTAGVTVVVREPSGLAYVSCSGGGVPALANAFISRFGISVPQPGKRISGAKVAVVGVGPGEWLVDAYTLPVPDIEIWLQDALGPPAVVVDQTDAMIILHLSGSAPPDVLATGVPIDLHPRAFGPGDAVRTPLAHIPVHLWQLDAAPTYEICVPRSMIGSFWRWLLAAGSRYGIDVREAVLSTR